MLFLNPYKFLISQTQNRETAWLKNTLNMLEMLTPLLYYTFKILLSFEQKMQVFRFFHYKSH